MSRVLLCVGDLAHVNGYLQWSRPTYSSRYESLVGVHGFVRDIRRRSEKGLAYKEFWALQAFGISHDP